MKTNWYVKGKINGGTTMRDTTLPECGNTALHVCINSSDVMKNRESLALESLPLSCWALPWQKHTANYYRVTADDVGKGSLSASTSIMSVDAVYTTCPSTLIGVFTADCCGILLVDPVTPLVCCIHSGWKGTAQAITYKTVSHLIESGLIDPVRCEVWFAPSIQQSSLEVGMEVIEAMEPLHSLGIDVSSYYYTKPNKKAQLDNQGLNAAMLQKLGIQNIHLSDVDTKTTPDCFSYRRDGKDCGEHFTFAWIEENGQ